MKGKIVSMLDVAIGKFVKKPYRRVGFDMEDGTYAKTDLVIGFRNYHKWMEGGKVEVGNVLGGLAFKKMHSPKAPQTIDADVIPYLVHPDDFNPPERPPRSPKPPDKGPELLGFNCP